MATPLVCLWLEVTDPVLVCVQSVGAELGEDGGPSLAPSQLSCLDRAERNSRALSLHYSITKSGYLPRPLTHTHTPSDLTLDGRETGIQTSR